MRPTVLTGWKKLLLAAIAILAILVVLSFVLPYVGGGHGIRSP